MHPVLRTLLAGVYEKECVLNCLLGKPHLIQLIWRFCIDYYMAHIHLPASDTDWDRKQYPKIIELIRNNADKEIVKPNDSFAGYLMEIEFPEPKDLNINMMPFMAAASFEESGLTEEVRPYWDLIEATFQSEEEYGEIWYLTIHEGWVEAGKSQRRPGLHTDNPGPLLIPSEKQHFETNIGSGESCLVWYEHDWGNGVILTKSYIDGGIFMASNVTGSCEVWNCKVDTEIVGNMGDLEHAREFLLQKKIVREKLEGNCLFWITDKTPHESLPLKERTYRKFFRVVTKNVSLWFEDHSTPNPNGIKPNPEITKIVKGNKFDPSSLVVVENEQSIIQLDQSIETLKI